MSFKVAMFFSLPMQTLDLPWSQETSCVLLQLEQSATRPLKLFFHWSLSLIRSKLIRGACKSFLLSHTIFSEVMLLQNFYCRGVLLYTFVTKRYPFGNKVRVLQNHLSDYENLQLGSNQSEGMAILTLLL